MNSSINRTIENTRQPVLVFLHYFGGSAESWSFVMKKLESNYTCIAIDLPGFGNTAMMDQPSLSRYADFIQHKINDLNFQEYFLVGHSMGGKLALQCAVNNRENKQIRGLILVAPSPPSFEAIPDDKKKEMRQVPDGAQAKSGVEADTIIRLTEHAFSVAVKTPLEVAAAARKWWVDQGTQESIASETVILKNPVTLIVSKDDPAVTWEMTQQETIPNLPGHTEISVVEQIGHLMQLENPDLIASMISDGITRAIRL